MHKACNNKEKERQPNKMEKNLDSLNMKQSIIWSDFKTLGNGDHVCHIVGAQYLFNKKLYNKEKCSLPKLWGHSFWVAQKL